MLLQLQGLIPIFNERNNSYSSMIFLSASACLTLTVNSHVHMYSQHTGGVTPGVNCTGVSSTITVLNLRHFSDCA